MFGIDGAPEAAERKSEVLPAAANIKPGSLQQWLDQLVATFSCTFMTKDELTSPISVADKHEVTEASAALSDDSDFTGINERRLLRKIDFRIVPWLSLLYLLNSLDRSNIGNSRVRSSRFIHDMD